MDEKRMDRFICGDYKKWDKNLGPIALGTAADVILGICRHCGYSEDQLKVVNAIMVEICYPLYEWDGLLLQCMTSLASGVFVTVMMSNHVNSLFCRYTFTKNARRLGKDENLDRYVSLNFMGDDNFATVAPECDWWDQHVHRDMLSEVGIIYTACDKESELPKFYTREQCTYLKRKFRMVDEDFNDCEPGACKHVMAPIEESSLSKVLHNYMHRKRCSDPPEKYAASSIDHCVMEYFRYPREVYDRRISQLKTVLEKHNLQAYSSTYSSSGFPTYDEMCTNYINGKIFNDTTIELPKDLEDQCKQTRHKRLIAVVAGSGWGKTTFQQRFKNSNIKVVDIDDVTKNDATVKDLRSRAIRGEIDWKEVREISHEGTIEKIVATQPDALLLHDYVQESFPKLALYFTIEEWKIDAPDIKEVVKRVRTRAKPGEEDRAECIARASYDNLRGDPRWSDFAIAKEQGSWDVLWKRLNTNEPVEMIDEGVYENRTQASEPNELYDQAVEERLGVRFSDNSKESGSQTMTFSDMADSEGYDVMSQPDPSFAMQDTGDADLGEFFRRPIKIYEASIRVGVGFGVNIDPWTLFFTNPRNINRLTNYNLMRCALKLKIVINGNPFYYGRFLVSYLPLQSEDTLDDNDTTLFSTLTITSQRPHIYLDPTLSMGGEMMLPYFYFKNNLSVPGAEWDKMGQLRIQTVSLLKHANGGTDPISISIFAYACNMHLSIPTTSEPASLVPQGIIELHDQARSETEQVTGKVSGVASAIAKAAGVIGTAVPSIAPYMMVSSAIAETASGIARAFGMSRPRLTSTVPGRYKPEYYANLANCDVGEQKYGLGVDAANEVTIDPRVTGLSSVDEMAIGNIVSHESIFHRFDWTSGTGQDVCIGQVRVDPGLFRLEDFTRHYLTSTAYVTNAFSHWTGTLNFRFQVICSAYHRGRLKIAYDPSFLQSAEYNVNYIKIIDISETKDFTVSISPCQTLPLMQPFGLGDSVGELYTTGATLNADVKGNGVLGVYVVNTLTSPGIASDIEIIVSVSAGSDFEVFGPRDTFLKGMLLTTPIAPELLNEGVEEVGKTPETDEPVGSPDAMGLTTSSQDYAKLNKIFYGESIKSVATLLKRYTLHSSWGPGPTVTPRVVSYRRTTSIFPFNRGTVPGAVHSSSLTPYNYCYTTPLNYFSWGYVAWRGSLSWKMGCMTNVVYGESTTGKGTLSVFRNSDPPLTSYSLSEENLSADSTDSINARRIIGSQTQSGWEGTSITTNDQYPFIETEFPYYTNKRFMHCRIKDRTSLIDTTLEGLDGKTGNLRCYSDSQNVTSVDEYVAAGDDFRLYFYIGPPTLYYESSFPGLF
jgi:hypothetical protein